MRMANQGAKIQKKIDIYKGIWENLQNFCILQGKVRVLRSSWCPEAADVVAQGFGGDKAEAVLLGYVVEFYSCWHIF